MSGTVVYVAKYGDYLVKIAQEHGTTWQAIWNHPLNAEHRQKRGSPDVLYPGDVLHVPVAAAPAEPPAPPIPVEPPAQPPPPKPPSWPYPPPPPRLGLPSVPTWDCPCGICTCLGNHGDTEL
ncbi:MAG: LysM peptidoglycan-binding domain-containing protein, partial [Polyangiaceae bacterium]